MLQPSALLLIFSCGPRHTDTVIKYVYICDGRVDDPPSHPLSSPQCFVGKSHLLADLSGIQCNKLLMRKES